MWMRRSRTTMIAFPLLSFVLIVQRAEGFTSPHCPLPDRRPCHRPWSSQPPPSRRPRFKHGHEPVDSSSTSLASIIPFDDMWGNFAVLTGTATLAQTLGRRTVVGRLLGAPVTAMVLTFVAASSGLLAAGGTSASKALQLLTLQLATPLILLGSDLRDCTRRCGPLLVSFCAASVATIVACLVGWQWVAGKRLTAALGRDGLVIAAALMAKNIGGGINYIAVCRSLAASPQAIAAGLCIDNIFALLYFPATTALGSGRPDVEENKSHHHADVNTNETFTSRVGVTVQSVSTSLFASAVLLWLGERMGGSVGALPLTTLSTVLVASQLSKTEWLQTLQPACNTLGTTCLYLFFSTAGAPGLKVAESVRSSLLPLTLFLTSLYSIHGLILWLSYRLWGRSQDASSSTFRQAFLPQRLLVASSSAIGGPATSVALAKSLEWKSLEVPSLLVGNIGYAIATFCGLAFYGLLLR